MSGLVIGFSGGIGSGKSSVSRGLAETLSWMRVSFGDVVRAETKRRGGNENSRELLQQIGKEMIEADSEGLCKAVLASANFCPGDNLCIDGIRHVEIFHILTRLVRPSKCRLIFLAADSQSRIERIAARNDSSDLARADVYETEADLRERLPAVADVTIDATKEYALVVDDCLVAARSWLSGSG